MDYEKNWTLTGNRPNTPSVQDPQTEQRHNMTPDETVICLSGCFSANILHFLTELYDFQTININAHSIQRLWHKKYSTDLDRDLRPGCKLLFVFGRGHFPLENDLAWFGDDAFWTWSAWLFSSHVKLNAFLRTFSVLTSLSFPVRLGHFAVNSCPYQTATWTKKWVKQCFQWKMFELLSISPNQLQMSLDV